MPNSKQIVYLSQAQYGELKANGTITVDGVTVTYDENDIYVTPQAEPVTDVRVNGTSIASNGVADIPLPTGNGTNPGVVAVANGYGIKLENGKTLRINEAPDGIIKQGIDPDYPIVSKNSNTAVFYGLAKVAGHDEKNSTEPLGTYTPEAKSAISQMLNGAVSVSGTTPVINALPGVRYVCGEVATLEIILPASGIIDVTFESGSTPTLLTVTPPTGQTIKWSNGFDPDNLDADTTYEINILDGLGVAGTWT